MRVPVTWFGRPSPVGSVRHAWPATDSAGGVDGIETRVGEAVGPEETHRSHLLPREDVAEAYVSGDG